MPLLTETTESPAEFNQTELTILISASSKTEASTDLTRAELTTLISETSSESETSTDLTQTKTAFPASSNIPLSTTTKQSYSTNEKTSAVSSEEPLTTTTDHTTNDRVQPSSVTLKTDLIYVTGEPNSTNVRTASSNQPDITSAKSTTHFGFTVTESDQTQSSFMTMPLSSKIGSSSVVTERVETSSMPPDEASSGMLTDDTVTMTALVSDSVSGSSTLTDDNTVTRVSGHVSSHSIISDATSSGMLTEDTVTMTALVSDSVSGSSMFTDDIAVTHVSEHVSSHSTDVIGSSMFSGDALSTSPGTSTISPVTADNLTLASSSLPATDSITEYGSSAVSLADTTISVATSALATSSLISTPAVHTITTSSPDKSTPVDEISSTLATEVVDDISSSISTNLSTEFFDDMSSIPIASTDQQPSSTITVVTELLSQTVDEVSQTEQVTSPVHTPSFLEPTTTTSPMLTTEITTTPPGKMSTDDKGITVGVTRSKTGQQTLPVSTVKTFIYTQFTRADASSTPQGVTGMTGTEATTTVDQSTATTKEKLTTEGTTIVDTPPATTAKTSTMSKNTTTMGSPEITTTLPGTTTGTPKASPTFETTATGQTTMTTGSRGTTEPETTTRFPGTFSTVTTTAPAANASTTAPATNASTTVTTTAASTTMTTESRGTTEPQTTAQTQLSTPMTTPDLPSTTAVPPTTAPTMVEIVLVAVTGKSISVMWNLLTNTVETVLLQYREVSSVRKRAADINEDGWVNGTLAAAGENASVSTVDGLKTNSLYDIRLVLFDENGVVLLFSPTQSYQTCPVGEGFSECNLLTDGLLPLLTTSVTNETHDSVIVWWSIEEPYASSISVVLVQFKSTEEDFVNSTAVSVDAGSLTLTGLQPDTQYAYKLLLIFLDDQGETSQLDTFTTISEPATGASSSDGVIEDWVWVIVALAAFLFLVFLLCICILILKLQKKRNEYKPGEKKLMGEIPYELTTKEKNRLPNLTPMAETIFRVWEIPPNKLLLDKLIEEGEFSDCYKGKLDINSDVHDVLVKKATDEENANAKLKKDTEVLGYLDKHPNILNFIGACTHKEPVLVVFEYTDYTRLDRWLKLADQVHQPVLREHPGFDVLSQLLPQLLQFSLDVCRGWKHLVQHKCLHHSLMAKNILVTPNLTLKLFDLGFPSDSTKDTELLRWSSVDTLHNSSVHNSKTSIWSCAVVIWEILMRACRMPYDNIKLGEVASYIEAGNTLALPHNLPRNLHSVLAKCWSPNARNRPSFDELHETLHTTRRCIPVQNVEKFQRTIEQLSLIGQEQAEDKALEVIQQLVDCNIESPLTQARLMAVEYAATVFKGQHVPSKYALLLAAGDQNDMICKHAPTLLRPQLRQADLPTFVNFMQYIKPKATERIQHNKIKVVGELGVFAVPFHPKVYEKLCIYVRLCLAKSVSQSTMAVHTWDLKAQAPAISAHLAHLLGEAEERQLVLTYFNLLRQYVSALGTPSSIYRLLELVAMLPNRLAPELANKLSLVRSFVHSSDPEKRRVSAELYAIVATSTTKNAMEDEIRSIMQNHLTQESVAVQHGSVLTLGFIVGRVLNREMEVDPDLIAEVITTLVSKLSGRDLVIEGACTALGECGRGSALPITSETKLNLTNQLAEILLSSTNSVNVRSKAAEALSFITIGEEEFPHHKVVLNHLVQLYKVELPDWVEFVKLQFACAKAITAVLQGHNSNLKGDLWAELPESRGSGEPASSSQLNWVLDHILQKYIEENTNVQQAISIWLLILTEAFTEHPLIQSNLQGITVAVTQTVSLWEEQEKIQQFPVEIYSQLLGSLKLIQSKKEQQ